MNPRRPRKTEPQNTEFGLLVRYEDIEPHLIQGELQARDWIHRCARLPDTTPLLRDTDILDLHTEAFQHLYSWAGQTRRTEAGPGGIVHVSAYDVRPKLRELQYDFQAWYSAMPDPWELQDAAELLARTHHQFEYIHPFPDTNGRTGRLLDQYVLWVSLGAVGDTVEESPLIVHFPDDVAVGDYFEALHDATNRRDYGRLVAYYQRRLGEALGL